MEKSHLPIMLQKNLKKVKDDRASSETPPSTPNKKDAKSKTFNFRSTESSISCHQVAVACSVDVAGVVTSFPLSLAKDRVNDGKATIAGSPIVATAPIPTTQSNDTNVVDIKNKPSNISRLVRLRPSALTLVNDDSASRCIRNDVVNTTRHQKDISASHHLSDDNSYPPSPLQLHSSFSPTPSPGCRVGPDAISSNPANEHETTTGRLKNKFMLFHQRNKKLFSRQHTGAQLLSPTATIAYSAYNYGVGGGIASCDMEAPGDVVAPSASRSSKSESIDRSGSHKGVYRTDECGKSDCCLNDAVDRVGDAVPSNKLSPSLPPSGVMVDSSSPIYHELDPIDIRRCSETMGDSGGSHTYQSIIEIKEDLKKLHELSKINNSTTSLLSAATVTAADFSPGVEDSFETAPLTPEHSPRFECHTPSDPILDSSASQKNSSRHFFFSKLRLPKRSSSSQQQQQLQIQQQQLEQKQLQQQQYLLQQQQQQMHLQQQRHMLQQQKQKSSDRFIDKNSSLQSTPKHLTLQHRQNKSVSNDTNSPRPLHHAFSQQNILTTSSATNSPFTPNSRRQQFLFNEQPLSPLPSHGLQPQQKSAPSAVDYNSDAPRSPRRLTRLQTFGNKLSATAGNSPTTVCEANEKRVMSSTTASASLEINYSNRNVVAVASILDENGENVSSPVANLKSTTRFRFTPPHAAAAAAAAEDAAVDGSRNVAGCVNIDAASNSDDRTSSSPSLRNSSRHAANKLALADEKPAGSRSRSKSSLSNKHITAGVKPTSELVSSPASRRSSPSRSATVTATPPCNGTPKHAELIADMVLLQQQHRQRLQQSSTCDERKLLPSATNNCRSYTGNNKNMTTIFYSAPDEIRLKTHALYALPNVSPSRTASQIEASHRTVISSECIHPMVADLRESQRGQNSSSSIESLNSADDNLIFDFGDGKGGLASEIGRGVGLGDSNERLNTISSRRSTFASPSCGVRMARMRAVRRTSDSIRADNQEPSSSDQTLLMTPPPFSAAQEFFAATSEYAAAAVTGSSGTRSSRTRKDASSQTLLMPAVKQLKSSGRLLFTGSGPSSLLQPTMHTIIEEDQGSFGDDDQDNFINSKLRAGSNQELSKRHCDRITMDNIKAMDYVDYDARLIQQHCEEDDDVFYSTEPRTEIYSDSDIRHYDASQKVINNELFNNLQDVTAIAEAYDEAAASKNESGAFNSAANYINSDGGRKDNCAREYNSDSNSCCLREINSGFNGFVSGELNDFSGDVFYFDGREYNGAGNNECDSKCRERFQSRPTASSHEPPDRHKHEQSKQVARHVVVGHCCSCKYQNCCEYRRSRRTVFTKCDPTLRDYSELNFDTDWAGATPDVIEGHRVVLKSPTVRKEGTGMYEGDASMRRGRLAPVESAAMDISRKANGSGGEIGCRSRLKPPRKSASRCLGGLAESSLSESMSNIDGSPPRSPLRSPPRSPLSGSPLSSISTPNDQRLQHQPCEQRH